jgi:RNA polymerase sigma-54 factor
MALSPRLDLRQAQALVMTPQLQQAIKLLQLSQLDLAAYVEQELVENPLLERSDDDAPAQAADADSDHTRADNAESASIEAVDAEPEPADTSELAERDTMPADDAPLDTDFENVWTNGDAPSPVEDAAPSGGDAFESWGGGGRRDFGDSEFGIENTVSEGTTLRQHLLDQLNVDIEDPAERMIGQLLIEYLDDAGYMTTPAAEIADQLGCPETQVDAVLERMQGFDPTGVFARSVTECFALQLAERDRLDPAMQTLIENLELLAAHELPELMKLCGVDAQDLADMIGELKALNPRPGALFDDTVSQWISPDVLMRPLSKGGWAIELNTEALPRVLVNNAYYAEIRAQAKGKPADIEYLSKRLQAANWLVKSLHQRATTILKVATEIVRQQDEFFRKGINYLRPLVLRDIAEAIDMHESTVSRVTNNKYIATPRGIFEMKYFFTTSIASADGSGDAHSSEAVRHRIKTLIDAEAPGKILSDDKIVEILRTDGVDIARRTVAKYRDALHIPSSVQRRRLKAAKTK